MTNLIPANPLENITRIEYKGQPVLTTMQLALALSTPDKIVTSKNLSYNFKNNEDRYIEGKHYFKLEGAALETFKNCSGNSGLVGNRTPVLYLWTKRGVARHCKSVGTDVAWNVFEQLEDTYFAVERLIADKPLKSISDFERGKELAKIVPHAKDPFTKKRLVAKAANLILGEEFVPVPDFRNVEQLELFF